MHVWSRWFNRVFPALGVLCIATLAPFAVAQSDSDPAAIEVLERSFRRELRVNVVAIISQRDPRMDGTFQTVRVERDRAGRTHHVVLAPLRLQGMETVDDGERLRVYMPDQNTVINQPSPHLTPCDADWRVRHLRRNYVVKFASNARVAGREVRVIQATPRDPRMESRRFFVDAQTNFVLRLESRGPKGRTVHFDTKEVQYPSRIEASTFQLRPLGSVRTLTYERPQSLRTDQMAEHVGFRPMIPENLPMGFEVQDVQLTKSEHWNAVAIRIGDGLVRGTIYQWRSTAPVKVSSIENSSVGEASGVRLMIVSDMPAEARQALLRAIARDSSFIPVSKIGLLVCDVGHGAELAVPYTMFGDITVLVSTILAGVIDPRLLPDGDGEANESICKNEPEPQKSYR